MTWTDVLWITVPALEVLWVAYVVVYILLERRSPGATLAWIFVLAFLPIFGLVFYFFFGPRRFARKKRRFSAARTSVRQRAAEDRGRELHDPRAISLIRLGESVSGLVGRPRAAELELYTEGAPTYAALAEAIEQATHHVHLEYYIWDPDTVGTRFRDLLTRRAKEGIEVRVLVDAFGSSKTSDAFWRPLLDAGGRVESFNPLRITRFRPRLVNFRSHRKIVVVDGAVAFTGGMNLADCHSSEVVGDDAWRDTHLRALGPVARGLQMVFLGDWEFATGEAVAGQAYFPPERALDAPLTAQVFASGPDENYDAIHKLYVGAVASARKRVLLTSPYFVPDEALRVALETASLGGAEVRLLVPKEGDVPLVAAAARSYYPELVSAGVRVFEYGPPVLHAKTLVVDDLVAVIGTANADPRSFKLNFEVALAAWDPATCDVLAEAFERDVARANEVTAQTIESWSLPRRIASAGARLFSPML
ncbi:MAG: cardiolipin synthase [Sandaracinus sp.]|nr:cardiolipin synthase [Myxococcales bacterium]MCB9600439.1 cardiolipin synthase [Sandaracinus sp.]MCB9617540.1 cardiolipin synthase [Sandaracinus sp.]MCB9636359.1 cardiolipin synthase [Sandaracinus sp.]